MEWLTKSQTFCWGHAVLFEQLGEITQFQPGTAGSTEGPWPCPFFCVEGFGSKPPWSHWSRIVPDPSWRTSTHRGDINTNSSGGERGFHVLYSFRVESARGTPHGWPEEALQVGVHDCTTSYPRGLPSAIYSQSIYSQSILKMVSLHLFG